MKGCVKYTQIEIGACSKPCVADRKTSGASGADVFTQGFGIPLRSGSCQIARLVTSGKRAMTGSLLCEKAFAKSDQPAIVANKPSAANTNTRANSEIRTARVRINHGNISLQATSRILAGSSGMGFCMGLGNLRHPGSWHDYKQPSRRRQESNAEANARWKSRFAVSPAPLRALHRHPDRVPRAANTLHRASAPDQSCGSARYRTVSRATLSDRIRDCKRDSAFSETPPATPG